MEGLYHDAFYRFVNVDKPEALREALYDVCKAAGVLGSILVAHEGINGMLAGTDKALANVRAFFEADERFKAMSYKRTACKTKPFWRLIIRLKNEIVPLGISGVDGRETGTDVSPEQWRELLEEDNLILIDNRNDFEYRLGHFRGAINPEVDNFREFAAYVENHAGEWKDKKVAMYCTGGIRCEKTSAWMKNLGFEVYQLEGGILNYFAEISDAERDYEGECFVFDKRVALDTKLQETDTTLEDIGQHHWVYDPKDSSADDSGDAS